MSYLKKPQRVWWRRALFQAHLWTGMVLGLYLIVIGVTGSLLVFKGELAALTYPKLLHSELQSTEPIDLAGFVANAKGTFPDFRLVSAFVPGIYGETYFAYMEGSGGAELYVFGDKDCRVLGSLDVEKSWLNWVAELHFRLFAGQTGFIVNGIGAACLVGLCLTGMVLWWPGIRTWRRALTIHFRKSWRRINFDLHSAVGFWTASLVFLWAISGVYFVWPKAFERVVNSFSSVRAAVEPEYHIASGNQAPQASLPAILAEAACAAPETRLSGFYIPSDGKTAMTVYQARGDIRNFSEMDHVYFDPSDGRQLGIWHAGVNPTVGSKLVYWLGPLHFGVYWGLGVKIIWALLGLSLPALTVTGAVMYWNRSLSKLWSKWRSRKSALIAQVCAGERLEEPGSSQ